MELKSLQAVIWAGVEFRLEDGFAPAAEPQPDGTTRWVYTGHLETAEGGKTFDSPVYGRGNIDDILITLIGEADGTQRLRVAVPASAIPIRVNTVTLNAEQEPIDNVSNNAYPLRVCYTVGLQADAQNPDGTLNTAAGGVSESYLAAHTVDGQVLFYSNLYTGQVQGQDTVGEATVQFPRPIPTPSTSSSRTPPLYLDPACTIRADDPTFDTARDYYFQDAYYAGFGEAVQARTYVIRRQGQNLADSVARDAGGWYIEKDAARLGNLTDLIRLKGDGNRTDTAAAANYPTFVGGGRAHRVVFGLPGQQRAACAGGAGQPDHRQGGHRRRRPDPAGHCGLPGYPARAGQGQPDGCSHPPLCRWQHRRPGRCGWMRPVKRSFRFRQAKR